MNKQVVLIVDVVGVVVDVVDLIIVWQFFLKKICRLKLLNTLLKLASRQTILITFLIISFDNNVPV